MNNKDIENRINQAFSKVDNNSDVLLNKILSDCQTTERRRIVVMEEKSNKGFRIAAGLALAFALVLGIFFAYDNTNRVNNVVAATISLDVNPSIEIQINKQQKVLNVTANNEDATKVIGDMDFKGSDLKVTVNALIGSLVRNGYINELANSILISVDDPNSNEALALEEKLMQEINSILDNSSVLYQKVNATDEIKALAEKYGITIGKAQLVKEIVDAGAIYTYDDLARLSINELNLLKKSNETKIQRNGQPSDKAYIGETKAKEIALNHAGLKEADVFMEKVELDYEMQRMVYEVEFTHNRIEYDYVIDALTGEIIQHFTENDDDYYINNQTNNTTPSNNTTPNNTSDVTAANAKQIALNHAGVKESDISYYRVEKEYDDGILKYEIDFMVGNVEYDYEVDANTGTVIKAESEVDDDYRGNQSNNVSPQPSQSASTQGTTYKVENGVVYEYDDGRWEAENDKKVENGIVYDYDDDTGTWEPDKKVENGVTYEYDDDTGTWEVDDDD